MKSFKSLTIAVTLISFVPFSVYAEEVEAPPIYVKPILETEQQKNVNAVKALIKEDTMLLNAVESKKRLIEQQARLFSDYDEFRRLKKVLSDYMDQLEQRDKILKEHQQQIAFLHREFDRIYGLLDQVVDIAFAVGQMKKSPANELNQSLGDKKQLLADQDALLQAQAKEIEALRKELQATKDHLTDAKGKYDDIMKTYEDRIKTLPPEEAEAARKELQEKAREAGGITEDLSAQRQKFEKINESLKDKNEEMLKLNDSLIAKDKEIASLKDELAKSKEELSKSKEELSKSKDELTKSNDELNKSKGEADALKAKSVKDDAAIAEARKAGEDMKARIKALHERTRLLEQLADKRTQRIGLLEEKSKILAQRAAESSANNARIKELAQSIIRDAQEQIALLDKTAIPGALPVTPLSAAQITPAPGTAASAGEKTSSAAQSEPSKTTPLAQADVVKVAPTSAPETSASVDTIADDLRRQMDALKQAAQRANDDLKNKDLTLAAVQSKLDDKNKSESDAAATIDALTKEVQQVRAESQSKEDELNKLRRQLSDYTEAARKAQDELKNKDLSLAAVQAKLDDKDKADNAKIVQLNKDYALAQSDVNAKQEELNNLRRQIEDLKKTAQDTQDEIRTKDLTLDTIKAKLDEKTKANDASVAQLDRVSKSLDEVKAAMKATQDELDATKQQMDKLRKEADAAQEELKAKDLSLAMVQAKLDQKTKEDEALINMLKDQLKKTSDALIALMDRIRAIEERLIRAERAHDSDISEVQDMLKDSREQVAQVQTLLNLKDKQLAQLSQQPAPAVPAKASVTASAPTQPAAAVSVEPVVNDKKSRAVHALQNEINTQKALVVKLNKDLEWKDKEISRLKKQIKDEKSTAVPEDKQIKKLTEELQATQKKLMAAEHSNNRRRLKEALRDAKEQISTLKAKLKDKHEKELQNLPEYVAMANQVKSLKEGIVELIKNNAKLKERFDDVTHQLQQTKSALEECQAQLESQSDLSGYTPRPLTDHVKSSTSTK